MMDNIEYGQDRLKDIVQKEAREKEGETTEQAEDNIDLTVRESERALKGACISFVIHGTPKADIDSYTD